MTEPLYNSPLQPESTVCRRDHGNCLRRSSFRFVHYTSFYVTSCFWHTTGKTECIVNKKSQSNLGKGHVAPAPQSPYTFTHCPLPQNLPVTVEGSETPSNTWLLGPTLPGIPNGISINSANLSKYTVVTSRQTDRQTDRQTERKQNSTGKNRLLCSVAVLWGGMGGRASPIQTNLLPTGWPSK